MPLRDAVPMSLLTRDDQLKQLVDALDAGIANQKLDLDSAFRLESISIQDVEKWLKALGWKENWQVDKKRLLGTLMTLYRLGGTKAGIIKGIKEFTGIEVIAVREDWPEAYKTGQSLTDDEKRQVTVLLSNYPFGEDTQGYIPLVEQIAGFMKPAHAKITVMINRNPIEDFMGYTINSMAGKTIRYVAYMPLT